MKPGLPNEFASHEAPPARIQGYFSIAAARSVFSKGSSKLPASTKPYQAARKDCNEVRRTLEKGGFTILAESPLGISASGPASAYEDLSGGKVRTRERLMNAQCGRARYVTHLDIVGDKQPKTLGLGFASTKAAKIDGIVLERPRIFLGVFPPPIPPNPARFHLRVPADVAMGLSASGAHRSGQRGDGVTVAMPDSGFFMHPYFTSHGYAIDPPLSVVPGTDPSGDPVGHGTGESANVFAAAPGAVLKPIRAADDAGHLVSAIAAFLKAKELRPRIITCSWGGDQEFPPAGGPDPTEMAFALEIKQAVEQGIVVVFSAGNGQFSIEPQVPGVIAAGGAFMSQGLELKASDYASGYESPWFQGVTVPTVCGLVGMRPRAQYIMLPIPPGCLIDRAESQPDLPNDPDTDGTEAADGWALFSGTSAAAPQVAGVAALLLGAKPALTPAQVAEALTKTSIDVTAGRCNPRFNNMAGVGPDAATGAGLVNADAALEFARDRF